jgi:hypothetical protein
MPATMTPVIPPLPPAACPMWCIQCQASDLDEDRRLTVFHSGASTVIPLSRGRIGDHSGEMVICLDGQSGEPPVISLSRDDEWARLTMEEAEQLVTILSSLVDQARMAEFR